MNSTDLQHALDEARRRIAVLEAALRPFAEYAKWADGDDTMRRRSDGKASLILDPLHTWPHHATLADARRAAGVLACWCCGGEGRDEHGACLKCGGKGKAGA